MTSSSKSNKTEASKFPFNVLRSAIPNEDSGGFKPLTSQLIPINPYKAFRNRRLDLHTRIRNQNSEIFQSITTVHRSLDRSMAGDMVLLDLAVPAYFRCPISLDLMKDPVVLLTGITYDRKSIETWFDGGNGSCPVTNKPLSHYDLIPNHVTRKMIQDWCVANKSHGVERIPTPRVPITPSAVVEILTEISKATQRGDHVRCSQLAKKVKEIARESERNRNCISSNGAGRVLAASFRTFSGSSDETQTRVVLEDILSTLPNTFPLDKETRSYLTSPNSLGSLVSILKDGGLNGRIKAVLTLREMTRHYDTIKVVSETNGLVEALVKLVREPISPTSTKASLLTSFCLIESNNRTTERFIEMGMVEILINLLVDSDKSTTEIALGVIDGICSCELGKETIRRHALAVPVLVKKMLRVSDVATEFALSALWKICKNQSIRRKEEGCLNDAVQAGAFQKLLLLLQVGFGDKTKAKAKGLLKLLISQKGNFDCFEPIDLRGLKRA